MPIQMSIPTTIGAVPYIIASTAAAPTQTSLWTFFSNTVPIQTALDQQAWVAIMAHRSTRL